MALSDDFVQDAGVSNTSTQDSVSNQFIQDASASKQVLPQTDNKSVIPSATEFGYGLLNIGNNLGKNANDFVTTFTHHLGTLPVGIAQGASNLGTYLGKILNLPPNSPEIQKLVDDANNRVVPNKDYVSLQDKLFGNQKPEENIFTTKDINNYVNKRNTNYQALDTDSPGGYTGAVLGELAPYMIGGIANGLTTVGSGASNLVTKVLPSALPAIVPKIVGGAANFGAQSALIAALKPETNITSPQQYAEQKAQEIKKSAGIGALIGGGIPAVTSAGSWIGKQLLGLSTQQGSGNIAQAAESGYSKDPTFWDALTGKSDQTEPLQQAKQGLQTMREGRIADYVSNMESTRAANQPIDFSSIDQTLKDVTSSLSEGGHSKIGSDELSKIQKIKDIISEWRDDPTMHNAIGLDALKQRLSADYPSNPDYGRVQKVVSSLNNTIKNLIVDKSPEYAKAMSDFSQSKQLEDQITNSLSLSNNASSDTAIRKLQSLTRNNANTNYGNRLALAKALQDESGQSILPALSGQSMNTWVPRGIVGPGSMMGTLGYSFSHPLALATLPFQSPKLVGGGLYLGGQAARTLEDSANSIGLTPDLAKRMAIILMQNSSNQQQSNQP